LNRFHEDLERIGLRSRRQHDARRSFISLARSDGARKDILRWSTHAPERDQIDFYTTFAWATLCEPVNCARISLLDPATCIARLAALLGTAESAVTSPGTKPTRQKETPDSIKESGVSGARGGRDSNPRPPA